MSAKKRTKKRRQMTPEEELDTARGVFVLLESWALSARQDLLKVVGQLDGIAKFASESREAIESIEASKKKGPVK